MQTEPHLSLRTVLRGPSAGRCALLASFFAFDPSFRGGVFVAAGGRQRRRQGGPGAGGGAGAPGAPVKVADATKLGQGNFSQGIANSALLASFFAYDGAFAGGARVGAGDFNADGFVDVLVAPGPGLGARPVEAFNGRAFPTPSQLTSFFAFSPGNDAAFVGGRGR